MSSKFWRCREGIAWENNSPCAFLGQSAQSDCVLWDVYLHRPCYTFWVPSPWVRVEIWWHPGCKFTSVFLNGGRQDTEAGEPLPALWAILCFREEWEERQNGEGKKVTVPHIFGLHAWLSNFISHRLLEEKRWGISRLGYLWVSMTTDKVRTRNQRGRGAGSMGTPAF